MNRGEVYHQPSSLLQQMRRNPNFWSINAPCSQEMFSNLLASNPSLIPCHDRSHELPEPWSQLLLGGLMEEEEGCRYSNPYQGLYASGNNGHVGDVKQEDSEGGGVGGPPPANNNDFHGKLDKLELARAAAAGRSSWRNTTQVAVPASSPKSCVTTSTFSSSSNNILDFSNCTTTTTAHRNHHQSDYECNSNSTGSALKKTRIQGSSAQSPLKVRKEKLGDRIAALHQLVSPFGKTDTASVLLEAIGYIRFLQGQIEALSSPYLGKGVGSRKNTRPSEGDDEPRDLRSRGLCLVPVSLTLHVGSDSTAADFWAPSFGMGFR
ncbi:transcription factor bHLH68 [Canna indica]|uniref:Transcription factor bHLH68 n=1 Tax=Canna indica TaxID=4628 RepID=A0AAQ3Q2N3_9LILI|nr:transcription factor bHLH68 [Canna indica]